MGNKIEMSTIMKLFTIFAKKKWTEIDGYEEVMQRFGDLINCLKTEQVELIIELTDRYNWITYNEYHTKLRNLLKSLYNDSLSEIVKVFIFPVIKPKDEDKIKSGHAVMYMIDSIKPSLSEYRNIEFVLLNKFEDLTSENLPLKENEFLLLVDDYIGTGNTLDITLSELNKNDTINNRFAILTVMIQDTAKEHLEKLKIKNYNGFSTPKGISSHYTSPQLEKKVKIMHEIENMIPDVKNYRLGYEKSEALVTMIRTPNNTFPIFWKEFSHKGIQYEAPFSRY